METSAREVLEGKRKALTHGQVESEVLLELPGGEEILSTIARASAQAPALRKGRKV